MTVVILSAFVPTLIAQQLFQPAVLDCEEEEEALGKEDLSIIHHRAASPTQLAWYEPAGILSPEDEGPKA